GRIADYRWDFSDREGFTPGREVGRTYDAPGVYTARLTVTDDSGAINATARDEVVIRINHAPVASAGSDVFTSSNTVTFDASRSADADGDPLTYRWDFGDGTPPAGGVRVTHTYADGGTYPVILTVDDGTGLANATHTAAITVAIDRPPVADAGGNREVCAGDIVVLDGSSSRDPEGGLLLYAWDFGDGTAADIVNPTKTYETRGIYPVTLTVEDESGFLGNVHTDRVVVRVDESPIAEAGPDQTVCANTEVLFDGSASRDYDGVVNRFSWSFGDGTTGGGERPVHIYTEPGDHRVVLTIEGDDAGQCSNTDSDDLIVRVVEAPVARIDAPDRVPVHAPVTFDAGGSSAAAGEIVAWRWEFGDGGTAAGPRAEHAYGAPGSYVVTLGIETEGGATRCSAVTAQHVVTVNAPPVADAGGDRLVGVGEEVLFDGSGSGDEDGGITAYRWEFGDGTAASGMLARHRFREPGRYPVTLTVTDTTDLPNNTVTDTVTVTVNRPPEPVIEAPEVACTGEAVAFSGLKSSDADGAIADFEWDLGGSVAVVKGAEVTHAYPTPGIYEVGLAVDDGTGLNNSREQATRALRINRPPRAEAGPDRFVCPGEPVAFDGAMSVDWDGALIGHRWAFDDGTAAAEGERVEHAFAAPGVYDVRLTVTDDSGSACASAEDVVRVVVNAPPVADAGPDREGFVGGAHDQLLFDGSRSRDADGELLSFLWDLGDGVTLPGEKVRYAYAEPGEYTARLTVDDGSGLACGRASDEAAVAVRRR
ncbi:MAG TPA: PKD domain-containing protein, partial [Geminicoccaceae bacterium]|nr:PKD domain-containing protein [Geminicoccaceae bacterium]